MIVDTHEVKQVSLLSTDSLILKCKKITIYVHYTETFINVHNITYSTNNVVVFSNMNYLLHDSWYTRSQTSITTDSDSLTS